jgi:hypothetical protein
LTLLAAASRLSSINPWGQEFGFNSLRWDEYAQYTAINCENKKKKKRKKIEKQAKCQVWHDGRWQLEPYSHVRVWVRQVALQSMTWL